MSFAVRGARYAPRGTWAFSDVDFAIVSLYMHVHESLQSVEGIHNEA